MKSKSLRVIVSSHTEQNQRPEQSDRLLLLPFTGGALVAVMDGVGSFTGGDLAAETVRRMFAERLKADPDSFLNTPIIAMDLALGTARDELRSYNGATTCSAMVILDNGSIYAAHIGDSAIIRYRQGQVKTLTTPHRGSRHVLLRALHGYPAAASRTSSEWDQVKVAKAQPGDVYLLATDGCYEDLAPERMEALLAAAVVDGLEWKADPRAAERFVMESIQAGATDNSTAILVQVATMPEAGS